MKTAMITISMTIISTITTPRYGSPSTVTTPPTHTREPSSAKVTRAIEFSVNTRTPPVRASAPRTHSSTVLVASKSRSFLRIEADEGRYQYLGDRCRKKYHPRPLHVPVGAEHREPPQHPQQEPHHQQRLDQ